MTTKARTLLTPAMRRRLVARRKYCRLRQHELAEKLGCTHQHLSAVETGRSQPYFPLLDAWCKVLGMKLKVEIE